MKKISFMIIIFFIALTSLFSEVVKTDKEELRLFYSPSIQISGGSAFTYGLTEERIENLEIPRTSFCGRLELGLLAVQFNKNEFQLGLIGQYLSKTPYYNNYILKQFYTLGGSISYIWHPNYHFGLGIGYSLLFLTFEGGEYKGAAHELFTIPEITFTNNIENNFSVIFPVQLIYRKDLLTLGISIGLKFTKLSIMKAPLWLIRQQYAEGLR